MLFYLSFIVTVVVFIALFFNLYFVYLLNLWELLLQFCCTGAMTIKRFWFWFWFWSWSWFVHCLHQALPLSQSLTGFPLKYILQFLTNFGLEIQQKKMCSYVCYCCANIRSMFMEISSRWRNIFRSAEEDSRRRQHLVSVNSDLILYSLNRFPSHLFTFTLCQYTNFSNSLKCKNLFLKFLDFFLNFRVSIQAFLCANWNALLLHPQSLYVLSYLGFLRATLNL